MKIDSGSTGSDKSHEYNFNERKGMLMGKNYLIAFLLTMSIIGCATAALQPTIQNTITVDATFDQVWAAVVSTIADISMPIESIEKDSGLITTKPVIFASGYEIRGDIEQVAEMRFFLGAMWKQGRYSFNVFVSSIGENTTKIKVNSQIEAYEASMTKRWHVCYSKGVIEKQIFDSIRAKL